MAAAELLGLCIVSALALTLAFDYVPPFNPFWNPYRDSGQSIAVLLSSWDGRPNTDNLLVISLARFFWINWILLLFNLLPGIPFDEGRLRRVRTRRTHARPYKM